MKRMTCRMAAGWLALALFAPRAEAADWYVATNALHTFNGTAWDAAFTNIQDALDAAVSNDTIYIAGHAFGISTQLVWTTSHLTVRGGYAATNAADQPGPSDPALWPTVIRRASGTTRLLSVKGVTNGTLERVTLSGGSTTAAAGSGIMIETSTGIVLSGCIVENNSTQNTLENSILAAITALANTDVTVTNCTVRNNSGYLARSGGATGRGGGIYSAGTLSIYDSLVADNTVKVQLGSIPGNRQSRGGGVWFGGASLQMRNVVLARNDAASSNDSTPVPGKGDGLYVESGTANLMNCLVTANYGDGVYVQNGATVVQNGTIADNHAEGVERAGGTVLLTNSIVSHNLVNTNGAMTASFSLIGADPLFEHGYYLGTGSPAIGAGSQTATAAGLDTRTTQADGTLDSGTVDLGYHYPSGTDLTYADIYVAPAPLGNDGNNGTNAATPFKTMTKALATAVDGTHIHVATGVYSVANGETFPLALSTKVGVRIQGTDAAATVIDASGSAARVLALDDVYRTRLEMIALKKGEVDGGSAVRIENSTGVVLSGCLVESNAVSVVVEWPLGAAIVALANTDVTLTNCTVQKNSFMTWWPGGTTGRGGGIYSAGRLTVCDSLVLDNTVRVRYGVPGSRQSRGGGVWFGGSSLQMRNVLLARNDAVSSTDSTPVAGQGDGLYLESGTADLRNVTVAGNLDEGVRRATGTLSVKDSILWGNGVDSTGTVTLAWSCYSNSTDHVDGGSNITVNPLFVDTTYYHLQSKGGNYGGGYFSGGTWANASASSPCIDAGDPTSDYSREPEPNGKRVNLGCYGNSPVASKTKIMSGTLITIW